LKKLGTDTLWALQNPKDFLVSAQKTIKSTVDLADQVIHNPTAVSQSLYAAAVAASDDKIKAQVYAAADAARRGDHSAAGQNMLNAAMSNPTVTNALINAHNDWHPTAAPGEHSGNYRTALAGTVPDAGDNKQKVTAPAAAPAVDNQPA
jgi:hypothetical protein